MLAETGKTSLACAYSGMSRASAYALAARDRVFAAGWDAACHFARTPIADDLYEKGIDGITETVTRADGVTVTRHRYDSRLSIAVLNRLDRRCDRAEERGSKHLAAVRNWGEFLTLVGTGNDRAAEDLLDTAQDCQTCQLPERAFPIPPPSPPGSDPSDNVWRDDDGAWMTAFPPPPGFDGHQSGEWDGYNAYKRSCTAEEAELLDAHEAAAEAEEFDEIVTAANAERDKWFAQLASELGRAPGDAVQLDSASALNDDEVQEPASRLRGDDEKANNPVIPAEAGIQRKRKPRSAPPASLSRA